MFFAAFFQKSVFFFRLVRVPAPQKGGLFIAETLLHTIPPCYDGGSKILILGTFPSPKSRSSGFFYGHPQNRFWRVLAGVLGEPVPVSIAEKCALLLQNGIALWDVLCACSIEGADDASIRQPVPNELSLVLDAADIRAIFTTGGKAAALYKRFLLPQTGRAAISLPSTSPANCARSLDELTAAYRVILPYLTARYSDFTLKFLYDRYEGRSPAKE